MAARGRLVTFRNVNLGIYVPMLTILLHVVKVEILLDNIKVVRRKHIFSFAGNLRVNFSYIINNLQRRTTLYENN